MLVAGRGPPLGTARSRCPGPRVSGMGERTAFSLLTSAGLAKVLARPARAMGTLFRRRARDGRLSSVRMEAGRGRVPGRPGTVATGCPLKEGFAAAAPAIPRLRCRAGLFERHEQQAGEFLGAEAVGAGGDDEFAKLGLRTCLEVPWPRPLSRWLGGTSGPSSMVITTRSGSCASRTVALEPYLIALSTRLGRLDCRVS